MMFGTEQPAWVSWVAQRSNIPKRLTTIRVPSEQDSSSTTFVHAVIVCTRNRPDDVQAVIGSLGEQVCSHPFLVVIVDASSPPQADRVRRIVEESRDVAARYEAYAHPPSLARQRNHGVETLPPSVSVVHFLDDDVTLMPDYLETLMTTFDEHPEVGGIGGTVVAAGSVPTSSLLRRVTSFLFMMESWSPGKVLPSGGQTSAQSVPLARAIKVDSLGGCASYRRGLVSSLRFDDRLEGYSMDEDLDFSYRAGRQTCLMVEPDARLVHHVSPRERDTIRAYRKDLLVHRYWFVEKNVRHPLRKPAFWWKTLGSYLAVSFSRHPEAKEAKKGIVDAIPIVWKRTHPLLTP